LVAFAGEERVALSRILLRVGQQCACGLVGLAFSLPRCQPGRCVGWCGGVGGVVAVLGEVQLPVGVAGDPPTVSVDELMMVVAQAHQVVPGRRPAVGVEPDVVHLIDTRGAIREAAVFIAGADRGAQCRGDGAGARQHSDDLPGAVHYERGEGGIAGQNAGLVCGDGGGGDAEAVQPPHPWGRRVRGGRFR